LQELLQDQEGQQQAGLQMGGVSCVWPASDSCQVMGLACRTGAGTVPRLLLEGLLQKEARGMLAHVSAATVLDLLTVHTVGEHLKPWLLILPAERKMVQDQAESVHQLVTATSWRIAEGRQFPHHGEVARHVIG
jgi:hypothetical protein